MPVQGVLQAKSITQWKSYYHLKTVLLMGFIIWALQSQLLWRLRWEVNSENVSKSAEDIAQCGSVLVLHV